MRATCSDGAVLGDPRVEAFLADSVQAAGGKLYALGIGWNRLVTSATFPLVHHNLGIGVVVHLPYSFTADRHTLGLRLVDQDGTEIVRTIRADLNVGQAPDLLPGDEQVLALAFNLQGVTFPRPDLYSLVVAIDDVDRCRLPLRVTTMPTPPPAR